MATPRPVKLTAPTSTCPVTVPCFQLSLWEPSRGCLIPCRPLLVFPMGGRGGRRFGTTSYVALGEVCSISETQFPHL